MESTESTKVIPVVNNSFSQASITPSNGKEQDGLTGKMMTSGGDIPVLFPPSFANAEMASRAIEDAVSNPVYKGIQDSTSRRNNKRFTKAK